MRLTDHIHLVASSEFGLSDGDCHVCAIDAGAELILIVAGGSDDSSRLLANAADGGLAPHGSATCSSPTCTARPRRRPPRVPDRPVHARPVGCGRPAGRPSKLRGRSEHVGGAMGNFRGLRGLAQPCADAAESKHRPRPNSVSTERPTNVGTRRRRQQAMAARVP